METSSDIIKNVMETLGWSDKFVPIANEDNLQLLELIKTLGQNKIELNHKLELHNEKLNKVQDILRSTDDEFEKNLKLGAAQKSQYFTESHLCKLAENDTTKFCQLVKDVDKSQKELNNHLERLNQEKAKLTNEMDKLSESITWAKSALSEWREAMNAGEEANKAIEKLCKEDTGRADLLDTKRRLLNVSILKERANMLNAFEEKKSLELILESTSNMYRQAHVERRNLVNTWKDAVDQMNQREFDIKTAELEINNAQKVSLEKIELLKKEEDTLKFKANENKELEIMLNDLNVISSELGQHLARLEDDLSLKSNELIQLRKLVQSEAQKLNNMRHRNHQMLKEEKDRLNGLVANEKDLEDIKKRYEKFKSNKNNSEDHLKQIEEMIDNETKNINSIQEETDKLSNVVFRSEQQLKSMKNDENGLSLEYFGLDSNLARTKTAIKNFEKELMRQTEIVYGIDFNIQHAQSRIAVMQGKIDIEEAKRLEARRKYLEGIFNEKTQMDNMIHNQTARVEHDLKKLTATYQNSVIQFEKISQKLKDKKIYVEGCEKQQKYLMQQNHEKLVEKNMVKIKLAQMEKQIAKQNNKTYSLEKHKLELEAALNERLIELKAQQDILNIKRKCLIEERSQMKADIMERLLKIEQLKKRFECAIDLLGKNDDGSLVTAVQIKIEMAQEKYLLLNDGNELNAKIKKSTNEIKYMENTLKLMNYSNDEYKKVFETVNDESPETIKINELQNQYCEIVGRIKSTKENMTAIKQNLEILTIQYDGLEREFEEVQRIKLDDNDTVLKLHKELIDQETKLERADREMSNAFHAAKRRIRNFDFMRIFEKDILYREKNEKNNMVLQQLADLVDSIPQATDIVLSQLDELGLQIPKSMSFQKRSRSQGSWNNSIADLTAQAELQYKRYSEQSICSSSISSTSTRSQKSYSTSSGSKLSTPAVMQQPGLSIIKIDFPDVKKVRK